MDYVQKLVDQLQGTMLENPGAAISILSDHFPDEVDNGLNSIFGR